MADPRFYSAAGPFDIAALAEFTEAEIGGATIARDRFFSDVRPLGDAGPEHVSFLDNKLYRDEFSESRAGLCIARPEMASLAPEGMALLLTSTPYHAYARVAKAFYPTMPAVSGDFRSNGNSEVSNIHETAVIGDGCRIDPGAVVGAGAEVGENSLIGANAVVGPGCVIGKACAIGAGASVAFCRMGDEVIIHAGVRIGQDGFGFALGPQGHMKVPQLGRVIIGDDVEIGANTTIDRGTGPDTEIGSGTKIDNLVQIAHNVKIGRGCIIVSQVGISGSTEIGDFVMLGGQAGLTGHLNIGSGAKIAAQSGVMRHVEAGETVGGSPAKPMRQWLKEVAAVERMATRKAKGA